MRIRTMSRPSAGIRRCGKRHTPEPQEWPAGTFTHAQIETLKRDPDLVVEVLEEPAAAKKPAPDA